MKDVPKKELPAISGGDHVPVGNDPQLPKQPNDVDFPRNPFNPVFESPLGGDE